MTFSDFALLAPVWMPWGLAHVCGAISLIDPWIFYPTLAASSMSCLAIKFGPPARRFWCAAPCAPASALFFWVAAHTHPEFWALLPLAFCPLLLWVGALPPDPMHLELTEEIDG